MTEPAVVALRRLRRTRQLHRLGSLDWFEVAYRVYLFALLGGGALLMVSDTVKDTPVEGAALADVVEFGPRVVGLVVTLVVLAGLRGGANGGPLALEGADVAHVMLAPIDRRTALARPAVQRLRAALFAGAGVGGVAGQLAGRRLPGTVLAWFASGALFGATAALLWFGASLLAHTLRIPRWLATGAGVGLCLWQGAALAWGVPGPASTTGRLALWGWYQRPIDLVGAAVAVAATVAGLALLRRISLDALARRSTLVAQLRFAVTMQDLRTVILLRRQLNQEYTRARPWLALRRGGVASFTRGVWRRGWHGLLRFPAGRLVRMSALSIGIGLLHAAAVRGTTPAFVGAALASFVLGLELLEPLSQEVDQPDHTDSLPVDRGELMARHLLAPLVALVPFAVLAGAAAVASLGTDALAPAAILALPLLAAGVTGSIVSVVRDAPDPAASAAQQTFVPPEVAGLTTSVRLAWPLVVSAVGSAMVMFPRSAWEHGGSTVAGAVRGALGAVLLVIVVGYWVKVRDHVHRRVRAFLSEGRDYTATQRVARRELP